MASQMQRRISMRRKIRVLRSLTTYKSVQKRSMIMYAFLYIYKLKLQVEAIKREFQYLIDHIHEVKVENLGKRYLRVMVKCKKGERVLVSILEVFEELNMNVVEARVNAGKHFFGMEAVVEATNIDATILSRALLKVVQAQT